MPNVTATQLARGVRDLGYQVPGPGAPPPEPFLVKPTTVARAAVRRVHTAGAASARTYLRGALARELGHTNPSMRGNAQNTIDGLEHYIAADLADGRTFRQFGSPVTVAMPSGSVRTKVDVVVESSSQLSGRAVYWDGPTISPAQSEVIAYPFAEAIRVMFPNSTITDICVWQARRDNIHRVPFSTALARRARADAVLARL
jgi:hypothetical protein